MRRRWLIRAAVVLGPMVVVGGGFLALQTWERGALPWERPPIEDVDWFDLSVEHRGVRTEGVVHLSSGFSLTQHKGGCFGKDEPFQAYLYPFFDPDGWNAKEVRILLYTTRPPEDDSVDMEERIRAKTWLGRMFNRGNPVEGFLRPLGPDRWDPSVKVSLEEKGYVLPSPVEENILVIDEFVD